MKFGKISLLGLLMVSIGLGVGFAGLKGSEALVSSTVWVDDDDPTCGGNSPCFQTIQAAVEGVDDTGSDGGFVYIRPGHYRENVVIKRIVSLIGVGSVRIEALDPERPTILVSNGLKSRPIKAINNLEIFVGEIGIEVVDACIEVIAGNRITSLNNRWSRYGPLSLPRTKAGIWIERAFIIGGAWWGIFNNEISNVLSGIAMVQGARVNRIFMNTIEYTGYGIVLQDDAVVASISSNTFKYNGNHIRVGNTFKTRDNQIGVTGQVRAYIVNNQMLLSEMEGIAVMAEMAAWGAGLTIENNLITNSNMAGIYLTCQSPSSAPLYLTDEDPCPGQQGPNFTIIRNRIIGGLYGIVLVAGQGKILRNRISDNGITQQFAGSLFSGAGLLLGPRVRAEISHNWIVNNVGGVVYGVPSNDSYDSACQWSRENRPFEGKLTGSNNEIRDNEFGDLCPPDYPWPPGFRK